MKFLVDRCVGLRVAEWLQAEGHDAQRVVGPDPGDLELLRRAAGEERVLVTLDKHFVLLRFRHQDLTCGLIRLPDVPTSQRVLLLKRVVGLHAADLGHGAIIAVRRNLIRVSLPRIGKN
jgi:predicted nuclease of predicted toxin-antitoxin system